jgi:Ca2+-binding EF-hand superfamily protein
MQDSQTPNPDSNLTASYVHILKELIRHETKILPMRQALLALENFDGYAAFRRITNETQGGITKDELHNFLDEITGERKTSNQSTDVLFWRIDIDGNGIISWPEFLDIVLERKNHGFYQYGILFDSQEFGLSLEVESTLAKIFSFELQSVLQLENLRQRAGHTTEVQQQTLFDQIDAGKKGYFDLWDIHNFLVEFGALDDIDQSEICFNKLDEVQDRRIEFSEFMRSLNPVSYFKSKTPVRKVTNNEMVDGLLGKIGEKMVFQFESDNTGNFVPSFGVSGPQPDLEEESGGVGSIHQEGSIE